ncbi:hypothetical protein ACFXJ8_19000 [Nonomuraea sp. NPDC059194]|uniref:hypothetical protein n=1 Tax=Nonomuraea sp. NPDC059194 TaxID=3346764 RepID=UPI003694F0ED
MGDRAGTVEPGADSDQGAPVVSGQGEAVVPRLEWAVLSGLGEALERAGRPPSHRPCTLATGDVTAGTGVLLEHA